MGFEVTAPSCQGAEVCRRCTGATRIQIIIPNDYTLVHNVCVARLREVWIPPSQSCEAPECPRLHSAQQETNTDTHKHTHVHSSDIADISNTCVRHQQVGVNYQRRALHGYNETGFAPSGCSAINQLLVLMPPRFVPIPRENATGDTSHFSPSTPP